MLSCNNTAKKRAKRLSDSICNLWEMGNQELLWGVSVVGNAARSSFLSASTYTAQGQPGQSLTSSCSRWCRWPFANRATIPQYQPTKEWPGRDTNSAADRSPSSHLVPGLHLQWCGCCPCILPSCGTHRMARGDCWALEKHSDMWFVWWGPNKTPLHLGQHSKTPLWQLMFDPQICT